MKFLKLLTIIFLVQIINAQQEKQQYIVSVKNGLNIRDGYTLSANKIGKLPYGSIVELITDTGKKFAVNDEDKTIKGSWLKVKYDDYIFITSNEPQQNDREGYVFSGYLKKYNYTATTIDVKQINKQDFETFKAKAYVNPQESIKIIGTLDSIKEALKDRVDWFTEVNEYGEKRNDAIKSIRTNNGQKLIINQQSNDYGFSEDFSAYYPEYDILVFEGGHASDVTFSIKTGTTTRLAGNPTYIISSPKNTYRLNGYDTGQECVGYFFQKKEDGEFTFLTQFNWDYYDNCTFKQFHWINETKFIYTKMNYKNDSVNGEKNYFLGEIITKN